MPKINAFLYWLQHVETFSYLELVTSRGIFFVALHHSLQEGPSQQRIRTRHGSVPLRTLPALHTCVHLQSANWTSTNVCLDLSWVTKTSLQRVWSLAVRCWFQHRNAEWEERFFGKLNRVAICVEIEPPCDCEYCSLSFRQDKGFTMRWRPQET